MFNSEDINNIVKDFYNKTPFPDYDLNRFNSKEDLVSSAYPLAKILDKSIPQNASVIDVGTGTGQLAAYLSLRRKCVYGIDFSDSSLKKAESLKGKLGLSSLYLKRIDILDTKQIVNLNKKFDYVLCLGVLHHTKDPYLGFKNILHLLKPDGYIAVGLYNKYGRIPHNFRKFLVKTVFKNNEKIKTYFLKKQIHYLEDKERLMGWWSDQYLHPYETTHTVGEVTGWFKKNGIKYMHTLPSLSLFFEDDLDLVGLWRNSVSPNNFFLRFYKQLSWIWKTDYDGGYWITFGRKI